MKRREFLGAVGAGRVAASRGANGAAAPAKKPNLVFVFPLVVIAICVYLNRAMSEEEARLEPEHLLTSPLVIVCTAAVVLISGFLTWTKADLTAPFRFFQLIGG